MLPAAGIAQMLGKIFFIMSVHVINDSSGPNMHYILFIDIEGQPQGIVFYGRSQGRVLYLSL